MTKKVTLGYVCSFVRGFFFFFLETGVALCTVAKHISNAVHSNLSIFHKTKNR